MTTKVYNNNQISIPSKIRKRFNVKADDVVEWIEENNGEIKVNFREKSKLNDIVSIATNKKAIDSVKIQKKLYCGTGVDFGRH
jgi:AbrB family looped-hinge helix DNA binding protein